MGDEVGCVVRHTRHALKGQKLLAQGNRPGLGASALSGRVGKNVSANYLVRRSSLFILHHFPLKPKLEHAVGDEDAVLLQGNQFLVDEGFLDAVDVGFAAQRIGFCYSLSCET